ncbi:MAG TPA: trypsin-like peptidase domain-containing protein [Gemmatimonadaceae bacterium]|nr:trypsin-like peptidase domain-containing protein [Gemmatimonadaceae bacterium]
MSLELLIASGARAGHRERLDAPHITIGRHPDNAFRFDPERDLDVSARHAEIVARDGAWVLRDVGSRNGTWVNGARLAGEHALRAGDVVAFGEHGPTVQVVEAREAGSGKREAEGAGGQGPGAGDGPRSASVRAHSAQSRAVGGADAPPRAQSAPDSRVPSPESRALPASRFPLPALVGALLAVGVAGAYWMGGRGSRARESRLAALARANDSLAHSYAQRVASLSGRVQGLDSSLAASKAVTDTLRGTLSSARPGARADSLAAELHALESRRNAMLTAAQVDYSAIADRNGPAVTLIAVEWRDGSMFSGSGFCVRDDGTIVTNRHLVARAGGERPTRIAVIFSDTKAWLPAHVVSVSGDADLAVLHLDADGPFPTVAGVAPSAAAARVGKAVAIIGYPLGTETPMEGSGTRITARSTLVAGTVSKNLATVLQIDAYAGEGSSGSPVFDTAGEVVGVVYGGARESGGRIVYAVPSGEVRKVVGALGPSR